MHTLPIRRSLTIATALAGACFIAPVMAHADTPTNCISEDATTCPTSQPANAPAPLDQPQPTDSAIRYVSRMLNTVPSSTSQEGTSTVSGSTTTEPQSVSSNLTVPVTPIVTSTVTTSTSTSPEPLTTTSAVADSPDKSTSNASPEYPYSVTMQWALPGNGSPTDVTWPQAVSAGAAVCGGGYWLQVDTYTIRDAQDAAKVAAFDDDGVLSNGEDHVVPVTWKFVHVDALTGADCAGPKPLPVIHVETIEGTPDCVTSTVPVTVTTMTTPFVIKGDEWVAGETTSTVEHSTRPFTDQEQTLCPTSTTPPITTPTSPQTSAPTTPPGAASPLGLSTAPSTPSPQTVPAGQAVTSAAAEKATPDKALAFTGLNGSEIGLLALSLLGIGGAATVIGRRK